MAKKAELEIEVKGGDKVKGLGQEIRDLTKQLRQTPEGTKDWKDIYNKIDDLKDKMAASQAASKDWIDTLEGAGGPLGMLGKGLNSVKVATQSWGAALKATGIGLLVSLIGGLVAAFSKTEGSMKKLEPLLIGMEKIFGGLVEMAQPFLDVMLDLGLKALPYVTSAFKYVYSAVFSVLQSLGKLGSAVMKLIKGDFSGAWEDAKSSVNDFGKNFDANVQNFEKGSKKMTETEKKNLDKSKKNREDDLNKRLAELQAKDKLDEARLEKEKEMVLSAAETEQEKLDIEKKFAKLSYEMKLKEIDEKLKLYKDDKNKTNELLADKAKLEADYIKQTSDFKTKQGEIDKKNTEDRMNEELRNLQKNLYEGKITQQQYEDEVYNTKKKYLTDAKALDEVEIERLKTLLERKKTLTEEERKLAFTVLQSQIEAIDRKNEMYENDYQKDLERLDQRKLFLEQQRDIELQAAGENAQKKLEIEQKYAGLLKENEKKITDTKKAEQDARTALQLQYADVVGQFGSFLQQVAGKNKSLAKTGLIIEQAAGIAKIVINTQANASKAGYLTPKGIAELAGGAIGVAAAIAATVKGLRQIDSANESGGSAQSEGQNLGRNYAVGGMIEGPRHAQGGVMIEAEGGEAVMTRGAVTMFRPLLSMMNQMGGGTSFSPGAVGGSRPDAPAVEIPSLSQSPQIIKTYVVSNELTTEAEKQAKLKNLSTL